MTVALLTPPGRGAVATLLLVGEVGLISDQDYFCAANGKSISDQPLGRIVFGRWTSGSVNDSKGGDSEEVVLCRRTESELELHCHGGMVPAARILRDLESSGCRVRTWQELSTESGGRFAAESQEALAAAPTLRTASMLAMQVAGLFRRTVERLLEPSLHDAVRTQIDELLAWSNFGRHLTRPWQVVLTGRPNVGKSSLINALLGYTRSIVYDEPGTTRDVVTAQTAFDGWPVELADTAGLRQSAVGLEAAGIALAHERLATADCRVLLLDRSTPLTAEDYALREAWPDALVVAHKSDLPHAWHNSPEIPGEMYEVSSTRGTGIEALIEGIVQRLVPRVPASDIPIPYTERQIFLLTQARDAIACHDLAGFQSKIQEILGK